MANHLHGPESLRLRWLRSQDHEAGRTTLGAAIARAAVWLELEGVEGVAQGASDGAPCILVLASRPETELRGRVPRTFEGFPVYIRSSGVLVQHRARARHDSP